jgi:hypothetical protein
LDFAHKTWFYAKAIWGHSNYGSQFFSYREFGSQKFGQGRLAVVGLRPNVDGLPPDDSSCNGVHNLKKSAVTIAWVLSVAALLAAKA